MKKFSPKKVCILFCGDIFGVKENNMSKWLDQMPELKVIADIDPVFISSDSGADMDSSVWTNLAETIYQKYNHYDGFVVIHNIDNLLFTSSVLSFMLQDLSKPIIFTSGQLVGQDTSFKKSGIKANLINACKAATENLAEVAIMFGNRLLRANQATLSDPTALNAFSVPNEGLLGQIDFSLRLFSRAKQRNNNRVECSKAVNPSVGVVEATPLLNSKDLEAMVDQKEGLLVLVNNEFLASGLKEILEKVAKKMAVVVFSNSGLRWPEKTSLILVNNMTFTSALTKLVWALGQSRDKSKVKKLMNKDIAGEIIT